MESIVASGVGRGFSNDIDVVFANYWPEPRRGRPGIKHSSSKHIVVGELAREDLLRSLGSEGAWIGNEEGNGGEICRS